MTYDLHKSRFQCGTGTKLLWEINELMGLKPSPSIVVPLCLGLCCQRDINVKPYHVIV
jgi:hypothetical protein